MRAAVQTALDPARPSRISRCLSRSVDVPASKALARGTRFRTCETPRDPRAAAPPAPPRLPRLPSLAVAAAVTHVVGEPPRRALRLSAAGAGKDTERRTATTGA